MSEDDAVGSQSTVEKCRRRKKKRQPPLCTASPTTEANPTFIEEADSINKKSTKKKHWEIIYDIDEHSEGKKKQKRRKKYEGVSGENSAFVETEIFSDEHPAILKPRFFASDAIAEASRGERKHKKVKKLRLYEGSNEVVQVPRVQQTEVDTEVHGNNVELLYEGHEHERKLKKKKDDRTCKYYVTDHKTVKKKKHKAQHGICGTEIGTLLYSGKTREYDTAMSIAEDDHAKLEGENEAVISDAGNSQCQTSGTPSRKRYIQADRSADQQMKNVKDNSTHNRESSALLSCMDDLNCDVASQHEKKIYKSVAEGHVDAAEKILHLNPGHKWPSEVGIEKSLLWEIDEDPYQCNDADTYTRKDTSQPKALKISSQKKKRKLVNLSDDVAFLLNIQSDINVDLPEAMQNTSPVLVPEDCGTVQSADASYAKKNLKLHSSRKLGNGMSKAGAVNFTSVSPRLESALTGESDALFNSKGSDPDTCGGDMSNGIVPEQTQHAASSSSLSPGMSGSKKRTPMSKSDILLKPSKQNHVEKTAALNEPCFDLIDAAPSEAFRKHGEESSSPTDPEFLEYLNGKHGFPSIHDKTKPSQEAIRRYKEETGLTIDYGKYTAKEDRTLLRNIYDIANYYSIRYPYMIVGHCGHHDKALQKEVKDLVKKEKLLRILGRGLPRRTIHSAYMRARILLNPLGPGAKAVLTPEQKKQVLLLYDRVGPKWTDMAQKMGLAAEQLRSAFRFFKEKESFATGKWERSEDDLLKEAVELQTCDVKAKLKDIDWHAVARHVQSRNAVQCKRRWTLRQQGLQAVNRKRKWNRFDSIHLICIMHELRALRSSEVDWETVGESFPWAPSPLVAKYHWESTLNFYLPPDKRKDFQSKVKNLYKIALPSLLEKYGKGKTLEEIIALSKAPSP
ncbi:transcription termination factor 1-like isoform X2 [Dermacentor albipictus]|uniref:transcription termination factor 1-like isoform X2 n=1 Tax=Dermacentor albipictus TaxID=60249 RepID=UPI0031FCD7F5